MEYPDLSYATVLAVDDSPGILCTMRIMLGKYGVKVHEVLNGKDAVRLVGGEGPVFNAVFLDYLMPEMDGMETVKAIRNLETDYAQNIPIIAMSAVLDGTIFLKNGFDDFLLKPITLLKLDNIIRKWIC